MVLLKWIICELYITFGFSGAEYIMNTFSILSRLCQNFFKSTIYIFSRFSRGSRRATGTQGSLLGKQKQVKMRQLPFIVSRGQHFTATCWSIGRPDQKKQYLSLIHHHGCKTFKCSITMVCKTTPVAMVFLIPGLNHSLIMWREMQ